MKSSPPRKSSPRSTRYIVGQGDAKRAVAVAVRNRWRRQQLPEDVREDVWPKNILMIGPTGVGKTEIARRLANLTGAPFIKVEATKYTEVGYHGRDVESMIRDLLDSSIGMVRGEMTDSVKPEAEKQVEERLLDLLLPSASSGVPASAACTRRRCALEARAHAREAARATPAGAGRSARRDQRRRTRDRRRRARASGHGDGRRDAEHVREDAPNQARDAPPAVTEARKVLFAQEAEKLIDKAKITAEAISRVEQTGIVFLDELDKVAGTDKTHGPDVSRQGVQRDLLPIVEGSTVMTKYGPVRTDHILFVAAGAFHSSKPSDLMPELQGRFPIRVELQDLTKADFVRILREPKNSLTKQQVELLATEGVTVDFSDDAIDEMAQIAYDVNRKTQNIGARRLYTIMERVFEELSFDAPEMRDTRITITAEYVRQRLADVAKDEDLSRFIL
jgi:ATP-dependent HslUV protease ATP-binding subunit HslU